MKEFFEVMDPALRLYWYIAIAASVVFVIQTIMTFIGTDTDAGVEADFDGNLDAVDHPFQLFSFRNLVNFLLGIGWAGVSFYNLIDNKVALGFVSFFIGIFFIAIFFLVMKMLMKLAEDNSFNIESVIGKTGDVYTNIPAEKAGKGKVFVSIKGSTHELDAITLSKEMLKTGTIVKITGLNGNTLVVEAIN